MAKTRGMTSLEIAVIVAIVLIIAVAIGWYIYTTFVAASTGQPRLNVIVAEISAQNGEATIKVLNPGPIDAEVQSVEVAGQEFSVTCTPSPIRVGERSECRATVSGITLTPGTMLPGRLILRGGQSFPFHFTVKP